MTKKLKLQKECNQKKKQRKKKAVYDRIDKHLNNKYILACRAVREIFCDRSNGT